MNWANTWRSRDDRAQRSPTVAGMVLAMLCCAAMPTASAQDTLERTKGTPELMRSLAQGGYVIYFRHGHTHWQQKTIEQVMQAEGRHDLANCATQRNLDELGRDDALGIHAALQAASIPVGKVLSSLYCRPAEYVALITGRTPVRTPWLTGLSTPQTLVEIKREVATAPAPGENTFLGGHGDRPFDLTGLVIQEGDALVFDPRQHRADDPGKFRPVAWIQPAEWVALTGTAAPGRGAARSIGTVSVVATPHHDAGNVRAGLPSLVEGAALDGAALARSLQLVRQNPAKNVEVQFAPSAQGQAVNAEVAVASSKPWALNAMLTHASAHPASAGGGAERLRLGFEHNNLWNRDHQAAIQVSQARGAWARAGNASLAYRVPLPSTGAMLSLVATRARDGTGLDADLEPLTGAGRSIGVAMRQHLTPRADYHHQVTLSVHDNDWFGPVAPRVRSRPLALGYAAHWEEQWVGWKYGIRAVANLPGGTGNDGASYAAATGAASTSRWNTLRFDAEWLRILTYDIRLRLSGRAQASNHGLIVGEQFALGAALKPWGSAFGVSERAPWIDRLGVRGLPERAVAGDSGAQASAELWSRRLLGLDLRAGGFVDLGSVRRHHPRPGDSAGASASSVGFNLHYQAQGQVALSLSAAHLLRGGGVVTNDSQRIDLVLAVRY